MLPLSVKNKKKEKRENNKKERIIQCRLKTKSDKSPPDPEPKQVESSLASRRAPIDL